MNWHLNLVDLATLSGVTVLVFGILHVLNRGDDRVSNRLEQLRSGGDAGDTSAETKGLFSRLLTRSVPKLGARLLGNEQNEMSRLQKRLVRAGVWGKSSVYLFVAVRLLLMIAPVIVALIASFAGWIGHSRALLYGSLAGGFGGLLPSFWIDRRTARRQMVLFRSLPDFLDLLVTCVESGLSLDGALRRVTTELRFAHPLLAGEMDRVQKEIELGSTPDAALQNFADRTDLEAVRLLGLFVQHARRFGTSIADALRAHADMLRARREQRAEELAQKAAVKILFPTLLLIFPAVFVVLVGPAAIQLHEKFSH